MQGHTTMSPRIQKTPYGDVGLTSRWKRDRYYLVVTGSFEGIQWMLPHTGVGIEQVSPKTFRRSFPPANIAITVERDLRRACMKWQEMWDERLYNHVQAKSVSSCQGSSNKPIDSISDLILAYTSARIGELAPRTIERNKHYLNRWLDALGRDLSIHQVDNAKLIDARQRLLSRLSVATINGTFAVLRTCFRWALDRGHLHQDPTRGIKPLRDSRGPKEKAWWTSKEVSLALGCARSVDRDLAGKAGTLGHTAELLVALGCLLGLRYEEIVMLRWEDMDLDAVHKDTGAQEPVCRVRAHDGWSPKDGEDRAIPIQTDLAEILRGYRKPSGYILEAKSPKPRHGGQKHTYRYDPQRIWDRVTRKVVEQGGKVISPHGMRHSFASNLLMAGVSDVLVARWLGHANTAMIHQRYGHLLAYHGDINRMKLT